MLSKNLYTCGPKIQNDNSPNHDLRLLIKFQTAKHFEIFMLKCISLKGTEIDSAGIETKTLQDNLLEKNFLIQ